ncbi:pyridoxamine 5'-phosphate oxidase family protein [Asanoa sp. WMMD1127]|uniref:pyridoxamine 5'-phosphate oxidase family protein n=1 Tax=Asanoa sp. WMMD1127 TaxID=3016107 RepID=UPI002416C47D|nr:pyridoxamine 5'-phosphate oxidase family protein [Asanoa sp. WMMD1127]MDG4823632.1 pyridoxamine 5'-phosphate oxidase family protein [Asanoa sp. WMMD1127]
MAKLYERIDGRLRDFIEAQHMFFVATAPSGDDGHVNLSPKGMGGTFAVLGEHRVAYLDFHGSGAETLAHLRQNGRITLMFCAFQGPPNIVRLHGQGFYTPIGDPDCAALVANFPDAPDLGGLRGVVTVEVSRVSDSCGYAVPLMTYEGDRDVLLQWASRKDDVALADYRRKKNATSIDGLPAFDVDAPAPGRPATAA